MRLRCKTRTQRLVESLEKIVHRDLSYSANYSIVDAYNQRGYKTVSIDVSTDYIHVTLERTDSFISRNMVRYAGGSVASLPPADDLD